MRVNLRTLCGVFTLRTSTVIPCISLSQEMEAAAANQDEEGTIMKPATVIKPLHKIISEHKDVLKIVIQLNSIISTFKSDIQEVLDLFSQYGHLWAKVSRNFFPDLNFAG